MLLKGGWMLLNRLNEGLLFWSVLRETPLVIVKRRKWRALHSKETLIFLPAVPRRFFAAGVFEMRCVYLLEPVLYARKPRIGRILRILLGVDGLRR
jgi:hypothetical protein